MALGSARRRQPARFAAFRTAGANDGAGPWPKPTLDPFMSFDGSTALIWKAPSDVVVPSDAVAAGAAVEVVPPEVLSLALPLLDPQPASTSTPADSRSARRTVTPRTLEARVRRGPRPRYSSSFRKRSTSAWPGALSASL